jgi:transcriptional regulator with XRE-family HTH domain
MEPKPSSQVEERKRFAEAFTARAKELKMPMTELAKALNVSTQTLRYWRNLERRPSSMHVRRMADVLGVEPDALWPDFDGTAGPKFNMHEDLPEEEIPGYKRIFFGHELRDHRENVLKLTRQQVADALGVSVSTVQNWENGTVEVSEPNLRLLAEVLEFGPAERLLPDEEEDEGDDPILERLDQMQRMLERMSHQLDFLERAVPAEVVRRVEAELDEEYLHDIRIHVMQNIAARRGLNGDPDARGEEAPDEPR